MEDEVLNEIIEMGKGGKCILFLGAMASAPAPDESPYQYSEEQAPPTGAQLSEELANICDYPDQDRTNLQRVALYHEFRRGVSRRDRLVKDIKVLIEKPDIVPSPALHMLAALPFPIVITTNYDRLFDIALSRANTLAGKPKSPLKHVYGPGKVPEWVPRDPEEEKPVLLKLHGDIDEPSSIVVTEEDYITFIHRMSTIEKHPIHFNIRSLLQNWPILFIGYSLKDFNLRLLLRALAWNTDPANSRTSYSVDPKPDDMIVAVLNRPRESQKVTFIKKDLWEVVPNLYRECRGEEYHA